MSVALGVCEIFYFQYSSHLKKMKGKNNGLCDERSRDMKEEFTVKRGEMRLATHRSEDINDRGGG